jgi:hypothetical protein
MHYNYKTKQPWPRSYPHKRIERDKSTETPALGTEYPTSHHYSASKKDIENRFTKEAQKVEENK